MYSVHYDRCSLKLTIQSEFDLANSRRRIVFFCVVAAFANSDSERLVEAGQVRQPSLSDRLQSEGRLNDSSMEIRCLKK